MVAEQAVTDGARHADSGPARAEGPGDSARTITLTVRYFAAARAAAKVDEERVRVATPASVAGVIATISAQHGDALTLVLARCSYLLGATAVRDLDSLVHDGDELDVLPPFAGG